MNRSESALGSASAPWDAEGVPELLAAGALDVDELQSFCGALAEGSADAWRALAASQDATLALCQALVETPPSPDARRRLLDEAAGIPTMVQLIRRDDNDWRPLGPPGIEARVLWRDTGRQRRTVLLRLARGAVLPAHRHDDDEECFVVSGSVVTHGATLSAGDYFHARAGTHHPPVRTVDGCVLLLVVGAGEAEASRANDANDMPGSASMVEAKP